MTILLLDQNFREEVAVGVVRSDSAIELRFARSLGLARASDDLIIEVAAEHDWLILTHDVQTFPAFITARVVAGLPVARTIVVPQMLGTGDAIEGILITLAVATDLDWQEGFIRLPFR